MNPHHNQNYSKKQIVEILDIIKNCIKNDRYTIALNEKRQENINFMNAYHLTSHKQKRVLLQLKPEDFCHSLQNKKRGYEHEVLYVFIPQMQLYDIDGEVITVDVYTKFNVIEMGNGIHTVVISFHKRNKPTDYLFR